jgi:hypothetical protein
MATQKTLRNINNALLIGDVMLCFTLRLVVDEWGMYKKGDEDTFYISLLDEQNGLVRHPIDKQWEIVSVKYVNKA